MRPDGYLEIFTFSVSDAEHELTWEGVFSDLKERGLNKIDLIISDGHNGIPTAAETMFPGASWQMCHVHFLHASGKYPVNTTKRLPRRLRNV